MDKKEEINIFKLSLLCDMIGMELNNLEFDRIMDTKLKCKLRNLKKGTDVLVETWDEMFKSQGEDAEEFGELSDDINKSIDNYLKELRNEKKHL